MKISNCGLGSHPVVKVITVYALVASLWILTSDWLLFHLVPDHEATFQTGLYKGLAFVAATSILLCFLMRSMVAANARIQRNQLAGELITPEFPRLTASLPVQIYLLEKRQGHYQPLWASDNVTRFTGYRPDDILAPNWWGKHLHPEDREQAMAERSGILLTGSGNHEYRVRCRDGSYIHVLDEIRPLDNADGDRHYLVGTWTDITQRNQARREVEQYAELLEESMYGTVEVVARLIELRDPYTAGHEHRVGELAAAIAALMGYNEHFQQGLRVGGLLHDIGKIGVPSEILTKPGKLTDAEYTLMKEHPANGHDILKNIDFPWPVADMAYQHHERMNGSGYPLGLRGDEICIEARIIAIADVVESMASFRPYRPGLGIDLALDEIEKNASTLYDQDVANACIRLFREQGYTLPD